MKLASTLQLHAKDALYRNVLLVDFTSIEQEHLRALLSRIPYQLLRWVKEIHRAPDMGAKHGRYLPDKQIILVNPHTFALRQRFGQGPGWINHDEMMVVHEVGHSVFENLPEPMKQEWLRLGGWVQGTPEGNAPPYIEKRPGWPPYHSEWTHKKGVKFPRHYSEKNPDECFADCFSFYLLGKKLQMSDQIADFVQSVINRFATAYPKPLVEGPDKK